MRISSLSHAYRFFVEKIKFTNTCDSDLEINAAPLGPMFLSLTIPGVLPRLTECCPVGAIIAQRITNTRCMEMIRCFENSSTLFCRGVFLICRSLLAAFAFMRFGSLQLKTNLFLSPLAGYTTLPFRHVLREVGGLHCAHPH